MERNISFYSDGLKIGAELFEPDDARENSCPGIVLCPTMSGHKEYYWYPDIARRLVSVGCVVLSFDFRSLGDSEGEEGRLYPLENAEDTRNALTYLQVHPKVDPERLGLYGSSWGGGMVPYVAGVDERVKCAVSSVGWSDGERWLRGLRRHWEWLEFLDQIAADRKSRITTGKSELMGPGEILVREGRPAAALEYVQRVHSKIPRMENYATTPWTFASADKIMEFKPIDVVDRISPRAILYIVAENDITCPADHVIDMYNRTKEPKKLFIFPGVPHHAVYEEPNVNRVIELIVDWMKQHLPLD